MRCISCKDLWDAGTFPPLHARVQSVVGEVTGNGVAVFQRIDQAGYKLPIDERILADTDTLMVFGLDHLLSEQEEASERDRGGPQVAATRRNLPSAWTPSRCGIYRRSKQRQLEYTHHGDALVPRQQRFGQYTRSMMKALQVSVINRFGLRPALVKGTKQIHGSRQSTKTFDIRFGSPQRGYHI